MLSISGILKLFICISVLGTRRDRVYNDDHSPTIDAENQGRGEIASAATAITRERAIRAARVAAPADA